MLIDGSCHCGRITYRAEIDPRRVYVCHCADCQAISGSPYRWAVPVAAADFELLSGTTKIHEKTGSTGRRNHQHFCPDCASPIYSTTPAAEPPVFNLRLGTARQRDRLAPWNQYWCRSAQGWALAGPPAVCVDTQ